MSKPGQQLDLQTDPRRDFQAEMSLRAPALARQASASRVRLLASARFARLLVLGLVCLAQLGCGFHLRGVVEIPTELNPLYIQAAGNSPVREALVDQLAGSEVALAATAGEARLILRIFSESRSSQVVAVDSSGRVLAYELHYFVSYDAVTPDGAQKVPAQSLDLVRNFDNPDVEVLGKQLEEALIYQDFARDAADRILMRLRVTLL
ncbi:LPS-assembly lipoprotein LptE [Thiocapsa marina]|uniref:LPS-assembly lipoprotein LptE n=1 Tax=Thiocapsa marina 5811 TaxID=768671 RepID=F9U9H8_9GAMM|nr:LPS assembly lipoprotein LptE [Thiocapsa marina]EGV19436.1 Rare lipoprotein B [Thiocapsa marina 5811]